MPIFEDKIISTPAQDELGRGKLVTLISNSITAKVKNNHDTLIYGIYGAWGEGKTSTMRMVECVLKQQSISCFWFNPWNFADEDRIVKEFFSILATVAYPDSLFDKIIPRYRDLFLHYGGSQSNPVVSSYQASLAKCLPFDAANIKKMKDEISEQLKRDNQHLVVFIDDVDRLDTTEVNTIFKMIRQVVDFSNVIYVIGVDPDVVSLQLGKQFGDNQQQKGRLYLEKIINVPIVLPAVQDAYLQEIIRKEVGDVWKESKLTVKDKDMELVSRTLLPVLQTKRAIDRFANQLSFIVPTIGIETEFVDLCLLESLKYLDEKGWLEVYYQKAGFLKEGIFHPSGREREKVEAKVLSDSINTVLTHYPEKWKPYVENILKDHLFSNIHHYNTDELSRSVNKEKYFKQYFIAGIPNETIPREDVLEFAKLIEENEKEAIKWINDKLLKYSTNEVERSVCLVFGLFDGWTSSEVASRLIKVLSFSDLTKDYGFHTIDNPSSTDVTIYALIIPRYLVNNVRENAWNIDEDAEIKVLDEIFREAPLNFCMCLFTGIYSDKKIKPKSDKYALFEILKERLLSDGQLSIFKYSYPIKRTFLLEWKKSSIRDYTEFWKSVLEEDSFDVGELINHWLEAVTPQDQITEIAIISMIFAPVISEMKNNIARSKYKEDKIVKKFVWNCGSFSKEYSEDSNIPEYMKNIEIFETLISGEAGKNVKLAILRSTEPSYDLQRIKNVMDAVVGEYVQTKGHNTFVEEHLDNPNIRIVISDFNDIEFMPYTIENHL